jgi:exportin-2 (importin alpha re-exporter)
MQASDETLQTLAVILAQTNSPEDAKRKAAEKYLHDVERQPGYSILLLRLLTVQGLDPTVQQIASIIFKNFVKTYWKNTEEDVVINQNDRQQIKQVIVDLMLNVPHAVQKQLSEALSIISSMDFPDKWRDLLPSLVKKLDTQDFKVINGVLETAHSIFRRFEYQFKSDAVLAELKYILDHFQEPLLKLFQVTSQLVQTHINNAGNLKVLFSSLLIMLKIFHSLCFVELPEYFEDHLDQWMSEFHKYLIFESNFPELVSDNEEDPGFLQQVQSAICENLKLFIGKYEEEFVKYLPTFVEDVWKLLIKVGPQPKNDDLVTSAIAFLASVAQAPEGQGSELFKEPTVLKHICEKVVIPNVRFRDSDVEQFKDNPQEYIRRDIEGSDNDTRRRSACELVKALRKYYENQVTQIFSAYIGEMLQKYSANMKENWREKDAAMYLVMALTVTSSTTSGGVTRVNPLVDVVSFFAAHVLPELQGRMSKSPVLKADALKFATVFRRQLPKEAFGALMPLCVGLLEHKSEVVHTYAAIAIDRLLTVKIDTASVVGKDELRPFLQPLLGNLFKLLHSPETKENDYLMKAVMRAVNVAKENMAPLAEDCLKQLNLVLARVYKNPTNPAFTHYLFEAIAVLVKQVTEANPAAIQSFEVLLFPVFQSILAEDITELAPYVFQLLSFLLEIRGQGIPQVYGNILPSLLAQPLWARPGNVPALVRLLQAYMRQAPQLFAGDHLTATLGVFQKLIASNSTDHEGYYLLESVVEFLPPSHFQQHLGVIFTLIFTRLQKCKSLKFIRSFLVFLSLFIAKHGANVVLDQIDAIQPKLFYMVLDSIWIPNVQKVSGMIERKLCCIAMTKLLTDCPKMLTETYFPLWGKLLLALMAMFEMPEDESVPSDAADDYVEVEETAGYSAAFSPLIYAQKQNIDPFPDIKPKHFLALSLQKLSQAHPSKFGPIIQQSLPQEALKLLMGYFQSAQLQQPYLS